MKSQRGKDNLKKQETSRRSEASKKQGARRIKNQRKDEISRSTRKDSQEAGRRRMKPKEAGQGQPRGRSLKKQKAQEEGFKNQGEEGQNLKHA